MRRRRVLGTVAGTVVPLAGCSGGMNTPTPTTDDAFTLAGIDTTESVELNVPWRFGIAVRNTTSAERTFRSTVSYRRPEEEWTTLDTPIEYDIEAGSTRVWRSNTRRFRHLGTVDHRLDALDAVWSVEVVPKTVDAGISYTTPDGLRLTVEAVSLGDGPTATPATPTGPGEGRFAAPLSVLNRTDSTRRTPPRESFVVRLPEGTRHPRPAAGESAYRATDLAPGERTTGRLVYDIPRATQENQIEVVWTHSDAAGAVEVAWNR